MHQDLPLLAPEGWYVTLPGPADAVLARALPGVDKSLRKAADAQARLYQLQRPALERLLASLAGHAALAPLVAALGAEDALRWWDLEDARSRFAALASDRGALAAAGPRSEALVGWARLREVEVLERLGRLEEARARLQAARVLLGEPAPAVALQAAVVSARLLFRAGDPAGALAELEACPPAVGAPAPLRGAWLRGRAIYTSLTGRNDRALGMHAAALECFKALGDRYHVTKQYLSLAQSMLESGELDHADLYTEKAAEALAGVEHRPLQALVASRMGMLALLRGELERAREHFARDLELSQAAGSAPGAAFARRNLGKVLVRLGSPAEGGALLDASREAFGALGDPVNERLSRLEAIAAQLSEAPPEALPGFQDELAALGRTFQEGQREALGAQVEAVRARVLLRQGALPQLEDAVQEVLRVLRRNRRADRAVEFLTALAADAPRTERALAERFLQIAYREAEGSSFRGLAARVLKALDEHSELAALALARAPQVATLPPMAAMPPPQAGFFEESRSPAFQRVLQEAREVARTELSVLLQGETGSGKDWLASYLHRHSRRSGAVYRAINCGAVAESLLEAELFGYEKGAFTGAERSRVGLFEAADGGTVFLDEVGELSRRAQAALLRVLDQKVVQPVGATEPRGVDVRILAATNRDLAQAVAQGTFRGDLYYRLAGYTLQIPALRERREDLPALVQHLLERSRLAMDKGIRGVDPGAMEVMARYRWPGNLRELNHVLQAASLRCRGNTLRRAHLPDALQEASGPGSQVTSLADLEREHIARVLAKTRGNQSEAARLLGIHRNTLAQKMRRYGLEG